MMRHLLSVEASCLAMPCRVAPSGFVIQFFAAIFAAWKFWLEASRRCSVAYDDVLQQAVSKSVDPAN